jgi:hypothetical protein
MLAPFDRKIVKVAPPTAIVDNTAVTTTVVDTLGYAYAVVNVFLGVTDIAVAELTLQESEESGANFANISGSVYGTSNNDTGSASTLPAGTADNTFVSYFVDLRGRKRYLDLNLTGGDGTAGAYFCAWAELYRGSDAPRTAAEAGYGQRIVL